MNIDEMIFRATGSTLVERMESVGLIKPDDEVASEPWETEPTLESIMPRMHPPIKDYITYENQRNKKWARLYTDMIKAAYGEAASQVLVEHHLNFQHGDQIGTEVSIPSADTLMFDHDIMGRIFGEHAQKHMMLLASIECDRRDGVLEVIFRDRFRSR